MEVIQAQAGGSNDEETNAQLQQIQKELDEANQNVIETNLQSEELQSTSNNVGAVGGATGGSGNGGGSSVAAGGGASGGGGY